VIDQDSPTSEHESMLPGRHAIPASEPSPVQQWQLFAPSSLPQPSVFEQMRPDGQTH
jgi:hypothetical protein